jgi:hypothetical protein
MKKINSLKIGYIILFAAIFAVGCGKGNDVTSIVTNPGGGNGGGGSTPDPTITWYVNPWNPMQGDTAFYEESKNLSASISNADSSGISGEGGLSFSTGPITTQKSYFAYAKNKSTGKMVTSTKTIYVYTPVKTSITQGSKWWSEDSIFYALIPDSLANPLPSDWVQSSLALDSNRLQFFTNNKVTIYVPSGPTAGTYPNNYYALVMPGNVAPYNETHISIPGAGLRHIEVATPTKLVFTERVKATNGTGFKIFRFVYSPK